MVRYHVTAAFFVVAAAATVHRFVDGFSSPLSSSLPRNLGARGAKDTRPTFPGTAAEHAHGPSSTGTTHRTSTTLSASNDDDGDDSPAAPFFAAPEDIQRTKKAALKSELLHRSLLENRFRSDGRLPSLASSTGPSSIPILDAWTIDGRGRLVGSVSNHPVYNNGDVITTSELSYDPSVATDGGIVTTNSGSQYRLGRSKEVVEMENKMRLLREEAARKKAQMDRKEKEAEKEKAVVAAKQVIEAAVTKEQQVVVEDEVDEEQVEPPPAMPAAPSQPLVGQSKKKEQSFRIGDMFKWKPPSNERLSSALGIDEASPTSTAGVSNEGPYFIKEKRKSDAELAEEERLAREEAKKKLAGAVRTIGGLAWNVTKTATKIGAGLVEVAADVAAKNAEAKAATAAKKSSANSTTSDFESTLDEAVQQVLDEASEAVADAEKALNGDGDDSDAGDSTLGDQERTLATVEEMGAPVEAGLAAEVRSRSKRRG